MKQGGVIMALTEEEKMERHYGAPQARAELRRRGYNF